MSRYQYTGRTEQTKAALKRLIDARSLQSQKRWRGAMYLAGYSIECKLKARLMKMYDIDKLEQLEEEIERRVGHRVNVFTHSIELLFGLTGVRDRLLNDPKKPSTLRSYQQCNTSGMREKEKQDLLWGAIDKSNLSFLMRRRSIFR